MAREGIDPRVSCNAGARRTIIRGVITPYTRQGRCESRFLYAFAYRSCMCRPSQRCNWCHSKNNKKNVKFGQKYMSVVYALNIQITGKLIIKLLSVKCR